MRPRTKSSCRQSAVDEVSIATAFLFQRVTHIDRPGRVTNNSVALGQLLSFPATVQVNLVSLDAVKAVVASFKEGRLFISQLTVAGFHFCSEGRAFVIT